jgi:adenylylsulfate kinase
MQKGFTVWFTGLSGSGKSTIGTLLAGKLKSMGRNVEVLDGDVVRTNLSQGLTFSKEDRDINIRRIGFVAHLLCRNGVAVICAAISPYKDIREKNRKLIGNFIEVYVKASVKTCQERDVKGLYQKALAGEIDKFSGISDPYEPPDFPEVICDTEKETVEESTQKIIDKLNEMGYL